MKKRKIILGFTGASGAIYSKILIEKLSKMDKELLEVAIVCTKNGQDVWNWELDNYKAILPDNFTEYNNDDYFAPFASGSAGFDTLIICPCSMGCLGRISSGLSNDLISRCADVILKERQKLILVTREAPLNLIHLQNMQNITQAGGTIFPASPGFYSKPQSIHELIETVVDRILQLADFEINSYKWGNQ